MLIQYLNKFLSQLKINNEISFQNSFIKGSNRNIKYLKGLVYRNINKTEKNNLCTITHILFLNVINSNLKKRNKESKN